MVDCPVLSTYAVSVANVVVLLVLIVVSYVVVYAVVVL